MISLLLSLLPLFIYSYFFFFLRREKDNFSFDINYGLRCYNCKEEIATLEENRLLDLKKNHKLCISCQRHEKLNRLTSRKINKITINTFLVSNNIDKYSNALLILAISLIVLGFFLDSTIIRSIGNIFNTAYALLFVMRFGVYRNKKPSH